MSKELEPTEDSEAPSIEEFKYDVLVALYPVSTSWTV